jgi:hypothetical protein
MFQDITTLLLDHKAFKDTVDIFVDRYRDMGISVVAGSLLANPPFSFPLLLLFWRGLVFKKWLIAGTKEEGIMGISDFLVFHAWILAYLIFSSVGC